MSKIKNQLKINRKRNDSTSLMSHPLNENENDKNNDKNQDKLNVFFTVKEEKTGKDKYDLNKTIMKLIKTLKDTHDIEIDEKSLIAMFITHIIDLKNRTVQTGGYVSDDDWEQSDTESDSELRNDDADDADDDDDDDDADDDDDDADDDDDDDDDDDHDDHDDSDYDYYFMMIMIIMMMIMMMIMMIIMMMIMMMIMMIMMMMIMMMTL